MARIQATDPLLLVVDASEIVAICAQEDRRHGPAKDCLRECADDGGDVFAPGVIYAEVLYALCRKQQSGLLTEDQHATAIRTLAVYSSVILPPPDGDASLVTRAEELRNGYGCSHSADGLYLALAETLAMAAPVELVTFDSGLQNQAVAVAPNVTIHLLTG